MGHVPTYHVYRQRAGYKVSEQLRAAFFCAMHGPDFSGAFIVVYIK